MITSTIGTATIEHEPDWSGIAIVNYKNISYELPGDLTYLLINSAIDIVTLQRDFEALRRQAGAFRITMQEMFDDHENRLKSLEIK